MQEAIDHGSGVLTLALEPGMGRDQVRARCTAALEDPACRCVVLLAAGADTAGGGPWMLTFPRPVLFVFADAVGPGLAEIALGADIRVCGPGAVLGLPADPSPWLAGRLARLAPGADVGPGQSLTADRLLAAGLVSAVVENPAAEGERLGAIIAGRGPIATELGKEALWRGLEMPLEQALRLETDLTLLLQTTKDRAEGVRAFIEKRRPSFTGD